MKAKQKKKLLKIYSDNLSCFYPEHKDCFMCPTCLKIFPINKLGEISEAHIIPKAAGGTSKVFLCKDCNSKFGTKQDKWFGDLLNILKGGENSSALSTKIKPKCFDIDGTKVNGTWKINQSKMLELIIHEDRNSPQVNEFIDKKFRLPPSKMDVSFSLPILQNQELINIGFLTAGYLMWFEYIGYSWVLQKHLDPIREQILEADKVILPPKFLATINPLNFDPWIGFLSILEDTVPAFGIQNFCILFPPAYKEDFYNSMDLKDGDIEINPNDIKRFTLPKNANFGPPQCMLFEQQLVTYPSMSKNINEILHASLYTKSEQKGKIMSPISKEKFEELKGKPNAKLVNIKVGTTPKTNSPNCSKN